MKKLFAILLSIIILGTLAIPVSAVTFEPGKEPTYYTAGDFGYLITYEGSVYITDYYGTATEELVIPATLDGHAVDGFWLEVFEDFTDVKSIVISEGITQINAYTFWGCSQLMSITIPTTVTFIGDGVFKGCEALQTVIYNGTEEQLEQVSIGAENEMFQSAEKTYLNQELPPISEEPEEFLTPSVVEPSPETTPIPEGSGPHMSDVWVLVGMVVVFGLCMVGFYFLRK